MRIQEAPGDMTGDFQTEDLIFMMKKISLNMEVQLKRCLDRWDMSGTQVYFMVYILRHHPGGSYITDMCREIGVSKATLSVMVKKLREKGYLRFQESQGDVRRKKIVPTEKLIAEGNEFLKQAEQMESEICSGLDQREREQLWHLEQKMLRQTAAEQKTEKEKNRRLQHEDSLSTTKAV